MHRRRVGSACYRTPMHWQALVQVGLDFEQSFLIITLIRAWKRSLDISFCDGSCHGCSETMVGTVCNHESNFCGLNADSGVVHHTQLASWRHLAVIAGDRL